MNPQSHIACLPGGTVRLENEGRIRLSRSDGKLHLKGGSCLQSDGDPLSKVTMSTYGAIVVEGDVRLAVPVYMEASQASLEGPGNLEIASTFDWKVGNWGVDTIVANSGSLAIGVRASTTAIFRLDASLVNRGESRV